MDEKTFKLLSSNIEDDNKIGIIILKKDCYNYSEMFNRLQLQFKGFKYAKLQTTLLAMDLLDIPFKTN